jgi:general secretion pathway protein G
MRRLVGQQPIEQRRSAVMVLRRGFTLLEVMLVLAIIIVLAGLGVTALMNAQDDAYDRIAQIKAAQYAEAAKRFKIETGVFPQQLQDLEVRPQHISPRKWRRPFVEKLEADPWGNPFVLRVDAVNNRVLVVSAGPDGRLDTEDDISNED